MKTVFAGIIAITIGLSSQAQVEKTMSTTQSAKNESMRAAWDDYSWDPVYTQHMSQYERSMNDDYGILMGQMSLTEDQKNQLKKISDNSKMRMMEIYGNPDLTNDVVHSQYTTVMSERRNQINAILTADQRQQYEKWYTSHPYQWDDMSWRNQWANDNMSIEMMRNRVGLNDEQYKRFSELNESYKQKQMAIMNDASISTEERHARIKALHDEKRATFKTLLNADQVTKFEMKDNGKIKIKTVENGDTKKMKSKPSKTSKVPQ